MKKYIIFVFFGFVSMVSFFISFHFMPPISLFTAWYAAKKRDHELLQKVINNFPQSQSLQYRVDIAYYKVFLQYILYNRGIIKDDDIDTSEIEKLQAISYVSKYQDEKNRLLLSRMYLLKGKYKDAMKEYWVLLKMKPDNDFIRYNYELLLLFDYLSNNKKKKVLKDKKTIMENPSQEDKKIPQSLFKIAPYKAPILLEKEKSRNKNNLPNY